MISFQMKEKSGPFRCQGVRLIKLLNTSITKLFDKVSNRKNKLTTAVVPIFEKHSFYFLVTCKKKNV